MATQLLAGAAVRSGTPAPDLVDNMLHGLMKVRFDEPGSPLKVKALALSFGDTHAILLALDTCVAVKAHCDLLRQAVAAQTGVLAKNVVAMISHSHSAPFFESLDRPHPYFDFVRKQVVEAAVAAWQARQPARFGHGRACVVGASFNQRVPLPEGRVKFTRDFREGLASGRPVDPRLSVIRIDDLNGSPIAGIVRFAAHPACVIFDTPLSAEYPGYMTDRLSETVAGGAPVLFVYGASGDVNCVPMFGSEADARNLGLGLAGQAAPVFEGIRTTVPRRMRMVSRGFDLALDPPPSIETLDREIQEVHDFIRALDTKPDLEWVLGFNCKKDWAPETKKGSARPLAEWAELVKAALQSGRKFPTAWPSELNALVVDDLGLVFQDGEPFTEIGLALAARSPLKETLLMAISNGDTGYLGTDEDRRRGGYEMVTNTRYPKLQPGVRPLPYALGAAEIMLKNSLDLINELVSA